MNIPAFIINKNRLSSLRNLVEWLRRFDLEVVIIDNASTYEPLLKWYQRTSVEVMRMHVDHGHTVGWSKGIFASRATDRFIVTDADLDLSDVPEDWLDVLSHGLDASGLPKCGFSLEIDDLPDCFPFKSQVCQWEAKYWAENAPVAGFFGAAIDTTFALYRPDARLTQPSPGAWRTDRPYIARHLPWYVDPSHLDDEELYFIAHASAVSSYAWRMNKVLSENGSRPSGNAVSNPPRKGIHRVAVVFDDTLRPDTTGIYCLRALEQIVAAQHFRPSALSGISPGDFDLFLFVDDGLDYPIPTHLRPSAFWAIDTHYNPERIRRRALDADFVFAAQRNAVESLRSHGSRCLGWLPLACDPEIHLQHEVAKDIDVCLIAHLNTSGRTRLAELIKREFPSSFVGQRFFEQMSETYSRAKIVLNLSLNGDLNMRVFETLSCGALLLTDDIRGNGLESLFVEGVHLETYRDDTEWLEKARYYLKNDQYRKHVAAAGRQEAISKHTYRIRMQELLRRVSEAMWPGRILTSTLMSTIRPAVHVKDDPVQDLPGQSKRAQHLGCVMAAKNRPVIYLQRALQTFEYQRIVPGDKVFVDFGSEAVIADEYAKCCQVFKWRYVRVEPRSTAWSSSAAYNIGVSRFKPYVTQVFKSDIDFLLGREVLETALIRGRTRYCVFTNVYATDEKAIYPNSLTPDDIESFANAVTSRHMDTAGIVSFPRDWFEKNGGFDLAYRGWGFEDSDLHARAERSIGIAEARHAPLVHQWHSRNIDREHLEKNQAYFQAMRCVDDVVRNGGQPVPLELNDRITEMNAVEDHGTTAPSDQAFSPNAEHAGMTSIVIVTHNEIEHTKRCLESICRCTSEPYELIVVDNCSTDGTLEYLRAQKDIHLVENPSNRGFPAAANQGIRESSGQQILLLNNDVIVTPGWLSRLLRGLFSGNDVGLVGPCSNCVSGTQQIAVDYANLQQLDEFAEHWARKCCGELVETKRLIGFCLLFRRELQDRIGLLDERFGIGNFEDDDYCHRAWLAGNRALIVRDCFVHHTGSATFRASTIDYGDLFRRNQELFNEKWSDEAPATFKPTQTDVNESKALPSRHSRISLCMIVRDSERTLRPCLESIRPWVDELIIVDTGSTDETTGIVKKYGAVLKHFKWCNDFSAARNESLKYATGDWILWMDSDDTIDGENGKKLREAVARAVDPHMLGFVMQVHCPGAHLNGVESDTVVDHIKMFRNLPSLRFEGRIHEQILPAIRRANGEVAWTDIFVKHSGSDQSRAGRQRKHERDLRLLELELQDRPGNPFALFNLGMTYADAGRHADAIDALESSRASSRPGESHVRKIYALLAGSYAAVDRNKSAVQVCLGGLKLFPNDPELLFRLGILHQVTGDTDEARTCYEALLNAGDERHFSSIDRGILGFKASHNFALLEMEAARFSEAAVHWHEAVREAPLFRPAWEGLIDALIQMGQFDEATAACDKMALHPGLRGIALALKSTVASAEGMTSAAESLLHDALKLEPQHPQLLRMLAQHYFARDDLERAERTLLEIIETDDSDGAAYHNLGCVYARLGRIDDAESCFKRSLQLRPHSTITQQMLRQVESKLEA
jgi:glycosyltransferase involved in cell wall biosynthesis/cytochrome c-type biogenesis protein CcmH/NrfG